MKKKKKNEEEIRRKNQTYFFSKLLTSVTSLKLFWKTIIFLKFWPRVYIKNDLFQ